VAVTSLIAVVTLSRSIATGIAVAILLAMYLLSVVAQMQPDLDGLATSAPVTTSSRRDHRRGTLPIGEVGLYAIVAVGGWPRACCLPRRDRGLAAGRGGRRRRWCLHQRVYLRPTSDPAASKRG
jgi:hypothetical protein